MLAAIRGYSILIPLAMSSAPRSNGKVHVVRLLFHHWLQRLTDLLVHSQQTIDPQAIGYSHLLLAASQFTGSVQASSARQAQSVMLP